MTEPVSLAQRTGRHHTLQMCLQQSDFEYWTMGKNMVWWTSCINTCNAHPNNIPSSQSTWTPSNSFGTIGLWNTASPQTGLSLTDNSSVYRSCRVWRLWSKIRINRCMPIYNKACLQEHSRTCRGLSFGLPKKQDAQDTPELQLCQTNWKGADDDPQLTWSLIQEELDNDWVAEVPGGMEEAQRRWQHLAVRKLNVVHASGRKPRLVLDSSCCGVNTRCVLPETMILPTVDDVKASFHPQEVGGTWAGLSLDIRAAHKQIRLLPQEQGLILFTFQNRLFHYKVAHFGGRFSAFWWSRLGALLLRLLHRYLRQPHRAWLYVDDLFLLAPQHELADMAWSTVVFLTILGTPISWKKSTDWQLHYLDWLGVWPPAQHSATSSR